MKRFRLPKPHLPKPSFTKKVKLIIFVAIAVTALAGGALAAYDLTRPTPEDQLYKALFGVPYYGIESERATPDSVGTTISAKSTITIDGVIKGEGTIACQNDIYDLGTVRMSAEIRQVDTNDYFQITGASLQTKKTAAKKQFEDYVNTYMANKWLLIDDQDPEGMTAKYYNGLTFGSTGAHSPKMSDRQMMQLMKDRQLITISGVQDTTYKGHKARQYSIETRRQDYDSFIDAVQPHMEYKTKLLDQMFGNDATLKAKVLVDAATGKAIDEVESTDNMCSGLLGIVGSSLASGVPERMSVISTVSNGKMADVTAPDHAMTPEEFARSLPMPAADASGQ